MFQRKELSLMAYNGVEDGANHLWFYLNSAEDDVAATGFFDDLADEVTDYDFIYVGATGQVGHLTVDEGVVSFVEIAAAA